MDACLWGTDRDCLVSYLFAGNKILSTCEINELTGIALWIARTLHALADTILCTLERAVIVSRLHHDVVILHDEIEGKFLPALYHLIALATTVVSEEFYTFFWASQGEGLFLDIWLKLIIRGVE